MTLYVRTDYVPEDCDYSKDNPIAQDSLPIGTVIDWKGKKIEVVRDISEGCEGCIFSTPEKECLNFDARCFGNSDGIFRKYIVINEQQEEETMSIKLEDGKKYATRDNDVVSVSWSVVGLSYKFYGSNGLHYTAEGRVYVSGDTSPKDLVKEWVEPGKQEGYIHAELMLEYAKDALVSREPWSDWEYSYNYDLEKVWYALDTHPNWEADVRHRRKPKPILINDYKVPEPLRIAPPYNTLVYIVDLSNKDNYVRDPFGCNEYAHILLLNKGLMHLSKEAAELHAKALLSFTTTL